MEAMPCTERSHVSSSLDSNGGKIERQLFIPFLEKLLDSSEIEGLEWMNKEKRVFRMPWKHMKRHDYDLERDSMLFKAWAVNSGKFKETEQDPSRWKINFRSALNTMKHVLVEEESGDEDCRIFRIVEPPSPQQRKRRAGEVFGVDSYSVPGYGSAPPAKHYPAMSEAEQRRVAVPAQFQGIQQQFPWQPAAQYVYPPGAVAMTNGGAPARYTYYTTAVDGHHGTATYYVSNQNGTPPPPPPPQAVMQPQQVAMAPGHYQQAAPAAAHYPQYMGAQGVAVSMATSGPGMVLHNSSGTSAGHHAIVNPAAGAGAGAGVGVPVYTSAVPLGQALMPATPHEHTAHMLSPRSLKTNNSCESLRSAHSATIAGSMTAIATTSAHSLTDDVNATTLEKSEPQPINKNGNTEKVHKSRTKRTKVDVHQPDADLDTPAHCHHRKSKKKFFNEQQSTAKRHVLAHSKPAVAAVTTASRTKEELFSEESAEEERDDEVIVDVVSCPMDTDPAEGETTMDTSDDVTDTHRESAYPSSAGSTTSSTASSRVNNTMSSSYDQDDTRLVTLQQQKEKDISAAQADADDSKRQLEQLEGSLAERNSRIVQMELQREQLNVCLHREWLIVKDLVSMVTSHKTQMEQLSLQLSHLRNGPTSNPAPSAKETANEGNKRHHDTTATHRRSQVSSKKRK